MLFNVKYLPLFHHFSYLPISKTYIILVEIVANASLSIVNIYLSEFQDPSYQLFVCRITHCITWFYIMTVTSRFTFTTLNCLATGKRVFIYICYVSWREQVTFLRKISRELGRYRDSFEQRKSFFPGPSAEKNVIFLYECTSYKTRLSCVVKTILPLIDLPSSSTIWLIL